MIETGISDPKFDFDEASYIGNLFWEKNIDIWKPETNIAIFWQWSINNFHRTFQKFLDTKNTTDWKLSSFNLIGLWSICHMY